MSRRHIRIRAIRKPLDVEKYVVALLELALALAEESAQQVTDPGEAA